LGGASPVRLPYLELWYCRYRDFRIRVFGPLSVACIDFGGGLLSAPDLSNLAAHQSDDFLLYLRIIQQAQEDPFERLVLLRLLDLVFSFGMTFHYMNMYESSSAKRTPTPRVDVKNSSGLQFLPAGFFR
jgi:hypothetical protein